jgi:hypothetical protein
LDVRYAVFVDTAAIVMPIIVLWLAFRSDRGALPTSAGNGDGEPCEQQ